MTREQPPPWMPTAGLARLAAQLLQRAGTREAFVVAGYAQLPVEDRSVTGNMENWDGPVRPGTTRRCPLGVPRADAILEVGVSNYEFGDPIAPVRPRLVLQVHVKLSDPTTKQVLGRARNGAGPRPDSSLKCS